MSHPQSGNYGPPGPEPWPPGPPSDVPIPRRPRGVTVAAVLAFVLAALRVLAGLLQLVFSDQAAWGSAGFFTVIAVLNFVLAPLLIWGGISALRGTRGDVLAYSALAAAAMEIFGVILAAANGGQTSRGAIALIVSLGVFRSVRTEEAKQFFAARRGSVPRLVQPGACLIDCVRGWA